MGICVTCGRYGHTTDEHGRTETSVSRVGKKWEVAVWRHPDTEPGNPERVEYFDTKAEAETAARGHTK